MDDPFQLARFVDAQAQIYGRALAEIQAGQKRSHWMWFIFPQLAGLGHSPMAQRYGISGIGEAQAYLMHPVLGARLREICFALLALPTPDPEAVFGSVDAVKLRSSMTLFNRAAYDGTAVFSAVLDRWYDAIEDPATIARL